MVTNSLVGEVEAELTVEDLALCRVSMAQQRSSHWSRSTERFCPFEVVARLWSYDSGRRYGALVARSRVSGPVGWPVYLSDERWARIVDGHPELRAWRGRVMSIVGEPAQVVAGRRPREERSGSTGPAARAAGSRLSYNGKTAEVRSSQRLRGDDCHEHRPREYHNRGSHL